MGALIKQSETEITENKVRAKNKIDITKIEVNPYQPRTNFDQEALEELASSIGQLGIIQPITVRETEDGRFQIISGERRYRASLIAGLTEIPAYIRHAEDNNMLEMALVENIQREDLDAIEVAISYQRLIDECKLTQENLSERVGKKRPTITNYLRLLKLPAEIQMALKQKQISMGHARTLVNIEQAEYQLQILNDIIENGLSVRQVEMLARQINNPEPEQVDVPAPETIAIQQNIEDFEKNTEKTEIVETNPDGQFFEKELLVYEDTLPATPAHNKEEEQLKARLSKRFGAMVDIKRDATGAGRVVIPFKTDAELKYILEMAEK